MKSEQAVRAAEKLEVVETAKALKCSLATITKLDGELKAGWAALVVAQAQALVDLVAA